MFFSRAGNGKSDMERQMWLDGIYLYTFLPPMNYKK